MNVATLQEQFSLAYIRAIATVAGFTVTKPELDFTSVDLQIEADWTGEEVEHPKIEVQAKCTSTDPGEGDHIPFDLPVKNHRDLRRRSQVPRLLVVVAIDSLEPAKWLRHSAVELALLGRGHFLSLCNEKETSNDSTVRVRIPRRQRLTVDALHSLMMIVAKGGRL